MHPRDERAAEYVDSPLMTQRLHYRDQVVARIDGRYGVYRTMLALRGSRHTSCTCPSDESPCKHVRALQLTWRSNRKSFFELEPFLLRLAERPRAALVAALAQAILAEPSCLRALGVKGFESDDLDQVEQEEDAPAPAAPEMVVDEPRPTALQGQYLAFIHYYQKIHGRAPAEADLQRYFRVTPPSVHRMLLSLHARGFIDRRPGIPRSIRLRVSPAVLPELDGVSRHGAA